MNFKVDKDNFRLRVKPSSLTDLIMTCGQSYKGSTIVNYDSRVVIWGNFKSGTPQES